MGQVSPYLRRGEGRYFHWCPGCLEMHQLPDSWQFNGDVNRPTFSPSFKHTGKAIICDAAGNWTGEWKRDAQGNAIDMVCHYFLRDGQLQFCADSSHALAGNTVPLPELPAPICDAEG